MFFKIVVKLTADEDDPFWEEMSGTPVQKTNQGEVTDTAATASDRKSFDSGVGSSLSHTPVDVFAPMDVLADDLNISRESGKIVEEDDYNVTRPLPATGCTTISDNGYVTNTVWIARSLAEREVMENLPAPVLVRSNLSRTPDSRAILITDRVGVNLTRIDRVIQMQNNMAQDYWDLSRKIARGEIKVGFRYMLILIGLDWSQTVSKNMIKEGVKRLMYAINRESEGTAKIGLIGVTPIYQDYRNTKMKMVTFNRCLGDVAREIRGAVQYLPLHRHFLDEDGEFIAPLHRYFNNRSEFTLAGRLVLREVVLKELGLIPMDGNH